MFVSRHILALGIIMVVISEIEGNFFKQSNQKLLCFMLITGLKCYTKDGLEQCSTSSKSCAISKSMKSVLIGLDEGNTI